MPKTADQPVWLTSEELAERLRIPMQTLYAWRLKGYGPPAMRLGRHLRFRLEAVERWEREQEEERSGGRLAPQSRRR